MALLAPTDYSKKTQDSFNSLLKSIQKYYPSADLKIVHKAYQLAKGAHIGQSRKDGSQFITHPLSVARILADLNMDLYTIVTGLLHDVVEDTSIDLKKIKEEFNSTVAFLVDGVSKVSYLDFKNTQQKDSENMRKMVVAMAKDVRVILVKLADRLHNMRTLHYMPKDKQKRSAGETLDIYAPLAGRLGMYSIKVELEDLAFQYTNPEGHKALIKKMDSEKTDRETYIKYIINILKTEISKQTKLKADITGRPKNIYSIYQKMKRQNLDYNEVYDVLAFRVCVDKIEECYKVLGLIHSLWKPIYGRFKDYIAIPKVNNYQSLHTTVLAEQGKRVEIQIRTFDMHLLAEKGIAAHWKYKTESWKNSSAVSPDTLKKFNWLQDLVQLHQQSKHSTEFLESVKMDLFEREIYVFTPKGDVKEFPKGATIIDFAYNIHTDIGRRTSGAKVNGRIAPLKYKLKSGDTVSIITSPQQSPSEEWLKYCITSKAKSKIKNFLRQEGRKKALEIGQKLFEKEIKKKKIKLESLTAAPAWLKYMKDSGMNKIEDLYTKIGYGKILVQDVFSAVLPEEEKHSDFQLKSPAVQGDSTNPIVVDGMSNIMVHFAKCCSPIPGDSITGFISRGKGVAVHRDSCKILHSMDIARYVDVQWSLASPKQARHTSCIKLISHDAPGVLKQISEVFAEQNVNIFHLQASPTKDMKSVCHFSVEVQNLEQLQGLISSLRSLKHIISVSRKE